MNKKIGSILPLAIFLILATYFMISLIKGPQSLPSMLEGQAVPNFSLPPIKNRDTIGFSNNDLTKDISLVNIFGSWCKACLSEHPFLMKIKTSKLIKIHGIDWREADRLSGPAWLKRHGDPYSLVGDDPKSEAAIAFGVTGAPETFLVDQNGIIRHKVVGPLSQEIWNSILVPLIKELNKRD